MSPRPARLRVCVWYFATFWPGIIGLAGYISLASVHRGGWGLLAGGAGGLGWWTWIAWLTRAGREDRLIAWLRIDPSDIATG